jgi:processive 1,2-diacylglycerol beta-glucosyltransferase
MKILLLHASAGAGHRRAAEALSKAFLQARPDAEVKVCDILDYTAGIFRKTYSEGYLDLVRKAPELWGYLYSEADRKSDVPWRREIRAVFNKMNTLSFLKFYKEFDPDIAVCTHFMPLQLLTRASRRRRRHAQVYCAVTDFAVHALWILENTDTYYVAMEEARRHLVRRGQPADRVVVTGIPIDPVFQQGQSKADAQKTLGLPGDLPIVLLLSGGFGVGPTLDLIRAFGQEVPVCRLVVVAGANEKMKQEAEALAATIRTPVVVHGFVTNIHVMIDACDLVISKPGGLTTSEVLAKGRPMLVINPIPGQEQRNCETILEAGAAARLFEVDDAYFKVKSLLEDREHLAQMSSRAKRQGRPGAAAAIVADIMARQVKVVDSAP